MSEALPHPSLQTLLDYWLGDGDSAVTDAVDEHLMRCEHCGAALDRLIALGDGVRAVVRAGMVSMVTTADFVGRLASRGVRVREYRLRPQGSVDCTVAPDDDLVVARLEVALQGVQRLDVRQQPSTLPNAAR